MTPIAAAIAVALVAAGGAYLVALRQFSGKIETSDAKDLWAESRSIREWSQDRIKELNDVIERMGERIKDLEQSNAALVLENHHLLSEMLELKGSPDGT